MSIRKWFRSRNEKKQIEQWSKFVEAYERLIKNRK